MSGEGQGFTLLELLMVIAVIGILLAVSSAQYAQFIQSTRVKEAATFVQQRLAATQASAKQKNEAWVFKVKDKTTFQAGPTGSVTDISLPAGTEFDSATVTALATVTFVPPYGARSDYQNTTTGVTSFGVVSSVNAAKTRTVKIVSLLGQVVVQ